MSLEVKKRKPRWDLLSEDLVRCAPRITARAYAEAELVALELLDARPLTTDHLFKVYDWAADIQGLFSELDALQAVVEVLTNGATKYPDHGWKDVKDAENVYFSALMRHLVAYNKGETHAPDSELHHLAHVMCNCMILAWHVNKRNTA